MRFLATTLVLLLLVTAGCGSDNPAGPNVQGDGSMSAVVDGQAWSSIASTALTTSSSIGTTIGIAGADGASRIISFAWTDNGVGTYQIGIGANATYSTSPGAIWHAIGNVGSGTITVTSRTDARVAGTFTFTVEPVTTTAATGTRVITQGTFNVTF